MNRVGKSLLGSLFFTDNSQLWLKDLRELNTPGVSDEATRFLTSQRDACNQAVDYIPCHIVGWCRRRFKGDLCQIHSVRVSLYIGTSWMAFHLLYKIARAHLFVAFR